MFNLLRRYFRFVKEERSWKSAAIGMNSSVDIKKDKHILMLDYDGVEKEEVVESVMELQEFWKLSDAYVFETKNGFHVFFWYDVMPFSRVVLMINYARGVDPMYKYMSRYYDHKTLRVAGKHEKPDIIFVGIVSGPREPTDEEWDIGELKRKEHLTLVTNWQGMHPVLMADGKK